MKSAVYNLILTVILVLLVVVLLLVGAALWYQQGSGKQDRAQTDSREIRQAEHNSGQASRPLSLTSPLEVSVNGRVYPIETVSARDNRVTISTKKELGKFADLEISINLTSQNLDSFSNRNLHFTGKDFSEPHIQVSWMEPGSRLPKTEFLSKNYDLQMQFGEEQAYRVPVQLQLATNEKVTVRAAGRFIARTSDLVVVNGEVDIHQDNSDTVLYVIRQFLERADQVAQLKSLKSKSHSMSTPGKEVDKDPNPGRVYSSATVLLEFDSKHGPETAEFQMVRSNRGWQVYRVIEPARLKDTLKPDLGIDSLFLFDLLGEQVVGQAIGKDEVQGWERKGSMLMHRHPDPKHEQTQTGLASYLVTVKDGSRRYVKLSIIKDDVWQIDKIFAGAQIPQAHAREPAAGQRGTERQKYLAARRLEASLNKQYSDLQVRDVNFSCGYSNLLTQCRINWWRLVDGEEKCEGTKYMYKREEQNSPWEFVQELAADEELDHRDGLVKKQDKPREYNCW